jgi:dTDP-4-amino-4,6-dideoxygalactose transaminase
LKEEDKMKIAWDYSFTEAVRAAVLKILMEEGAAGHKQEVELEKQFCECFGRKHAVSVSSGLAGLHCALLACGVGEGGEVIAPANTDWSVLYSIMYTGAKPVFCDVETDTMNLNPSKIEEQITSKTKAILAVSTAGHPIDFDAVLGTARAHDLMVINDLAQALGSKYKERYCDTFGDLSVSSFNYLKHISAGHVGIVTTDNEELAAAVRTYSHPGEDWSHHADSLERYTRPLYQHSDRLGYMYGPSELHCAIARVQLRKFMTGGLGPERRRKIAAYYTKLLNDMLPEIRTPIEETWAYHTYLRYIIKTKNRDNLFKYLMRKNVRVFIHYATPLHTYTMYTQRWGYSKRMFPTTEMLARKVLTLPSWASLTREELDYVIGCIVEFHRLKR